MATTIQIKRSANVAAPTVSDLLEGELAYSEDQSGNGAGARLYIESIDSGLNPVIHAIGGKYYTTIVDAATNTNTSNTIVKRDVAGNFTGNVITATTFVGNISGAVSSAVIANTANTLTTARDIGLAGDLTGNVSFNGSQNVTLTATIAANSVALGTDTTGNYLANVIPGSGLTGSGFGTEGATPTLTLATSGVSASTYGGTTQIPVLTVDTFGRITSAANVTLTSGVSSVNGRTGAVTGLAETANSLSQFASTTSAQLATLISDETGSGSLVFATTPTLVTPILGLATGTSVMLSANIGAAAGNVSGNFTAGNFQSAGNVNVAAGLITGALTAGTLQTSGNVNASSLRVTSNSTLGTVVSGTWNGGSISTTFTDAKVTSITGTANQVAASSSTGAITLSLPSDVIIPNNLTVTGDLIVQGTAVTMNTATVVIEDPLVKFGNANPSDTFSIGFYGQYTSGGTKYTGLYRDTSDGKFRLFDALATDPTTNSISAAGVTIATLVANLSGGTVTGLTSNITVGNGGTGVGTFTTNGILYGNATGSLKVTSAGTDGQVLQVNASGVPIFAGLDGGTY